MTDQEFIAFLWRVGAFWNLANAEALMVREVDLPTLTLADKAVRQAVASYQEADANLSALALIHHGRMAMVDGDAGPATLAMATLRRCGCPDHPPPPGVEVSDPTLKSMQAFMAEAGTGSWPAAGCDPDRSGVHSIRVGIDTQRAPTAVKAYLAEALAASAACYAEMGLAVRYVLDGAGKVEISKRFEALAGSVIGWNEFPRAGTCGQTIQGRLDTGFTPDMKLWANLEVHETGHGVGLEHTRGGIMNPSILLVWPLSWKGTPSEGTMRRFFGGEPIPGPAPPVPPGPPEPVPVPGGKIYVSLAIHETWPPKVEVLSVTRNPVI